MLVMLLMQIKFGPKMSEHILIQHLLSRDLNFSFYSQNLPENFRCHICSGPGYIL